MPWAVRAAAAVGPLDLSVLRALQGSGVYNPDFIHPLPAGPFTSVEDDLAAMLATPAQQIRAEVLEAYAGERVPRALRRVPRGTARSRRPRLGALMRVYWERALAPLLGAGARAARARHPLPRAARWPTAAWRRVVRGPRPAGELVRWRPAPRESSPTRTASLSPMRDDVCSSWTSAGLLLIPSVFTWPKVMLVSAEPWQPTVIYPARGVGMLWDQDALVAPEALAKLLGRQPRGGTARARLAALDQRARGAARGHRRWRLPAAYRCWLRPGLVTRQRVRRHVLYLRTSGGDTLVQVTSGADALAAAGGVTPPPRAPPTPQPSLNLYGLAPKLGDAARMATLNSHTGVGSFTPCSRMHDAYFVSAARAVEELKPRRAPPGKPPPPHFFSASWNFDCETPSGSLKPPPAPGGPPLPDCPPGEADPRLMPSFCMHARSEANRLEGDVPLWVVLALLVAELELDLLELPHAASTTAATDAIAIIAMSRCNR